MGKEKSIHTKLAGVTKRNDEGERIQSLLQEIESYATEGDFLELEHEIDNEYDENAIKVFYEGDHIGYIKRELAAEIAIAVDEGRVKAELDGITGGDGLSYGCNIRVYISDDPYPVTPPVLQKREIPVLEDSLIERAKAYISSRETVSNKDLQVGLTITITKAAALLDKLEELGYVGPYAGAQPRQVIHTAAHTGPTEKELKIAKAWAPLWVKLCFAILLFISAFLAFCAFISGAIIPAIFFIAVICLCIASIKKSVNSAKLIRTMDINRSGE